MTGRGRLLVVLLVVTLPLPLVGCGVPGSGPPVVIKNAPSNGAPTSPDRQVSKQTPADVTDPLELVRRYLKAVAWGNETTQDPEATDKAADAAKKFMTQDAQGTWQRGQEITVVRTRIGPPTPTANGTRVDVVMEPIGTLSSRGTIDPKPNAAGWSYPFTVVPAEHGIGLRIAEPPPGMLLSTEGLDSLYTVQPIYFWDTGNRTLVPDLRYISSSLSPANRVFQLTNWLRDGPSDYLKPAVSLLPAAIEIKDRPVLDGSASGTVRINLSAKAASVQSQLPKFVLQVRWSLRSLARSVEIQIEGQRQDLGRDAGWDNPAASPEGQTDPPKFGVVDGRVRTLGDELRVPALVSEDNANVVSAGILRSPAQRVALVREEAPKRLSLWLGSFDQATKVARYTRTDLQAETMSRPSGLVTPTPSDPAFLVAADGRLVAVSVASRQSVDRTPPGIGTAPVTAVSVARDGRRVALVAGGRVYVGVLTFEGSSPFVAQLEEVRTTLSEAVGVAWSREEWLVVAGRSAGQSALVELTIDSALVEPMQLRNLAGLALTRVVADPLIRPEDPPRGQRGAIMIEANGRTYRVYSGSVDEWPPDPAPSPVPSPSASVAPPKQSPPSAPFFLD